MKNVIFSLYKFSLLIIFLQSMFAWFFWDQQVLVLVVTASVSIFYIATSRNNLSLKSSNISAIFILIYVLSYIGREANILGIISILLNLILFSICLLLNDKSKSSLFLFFTKAFSLLLAISLFAWILLLMNVQLNYVRTNFNNGQYNYYNYYFFLLNVHSIGLPIIRFTSVFLEPGQLGMICSFFLIANQFEIKRKEVLIIFIANLLTFSLVAYILMIFSAFAQLSIKHRKKIIIPILFLVSIVGGYFYFTTLNDGDNPVNNLIIKRLEIVNGDVVGNNRYTHVFDSYFDKFINSNDKFLGIGAKSYSTIYWSEGNAGFKVYLVQHGIVGTILVFIFYLALVWGNQSKTAWVLFLAYILTFIQAAYPLWACELLLFITAMPYLNNFQINNNEKF